MMTQMLPLLHNLICHSAPLGQASHVLTFRGVAGGPRGVSETSAVTSHGCWPSCPQGPPTSSPRSRGGGGGSGQGTSQKKKSAWALLYLRESQGEDSLICIGLGRLQVVIITTNWASFICWVLSWHSAWVISQSFKTWVAVLGVRSRKRDTGDRKKKFAQLQSGAAQGTSYWRGTEDFTAPPPPWGSLSGETFPRSWR